MHLLPLGLLSLLFVSPTLALHESDVGVVDWHKPFIGVPLSESIATAPIFHRVGTKNTRSVVLTATESNVLGGINPVDGSIKWRHVFEDEDRILMFRRHENIVASLSGPGGAKFRSFDVMTGDLILEKRLHDPQTGLLTEPNHFGTDIAFHGSSGLALTNGHIVTSIAGDGSVNWQWTSQDQMSLVIYSNLVISQDTVYAVGLAKSFATYTIHISALSLSTGELLAEVDVPSTVQDGLKDMIILADYVVWLEHGTLFSYALTPALDARSTHLAGKSFTKIVDVSLPNHLVAVKTDDASHVITLEDGRMKSIWDFEAMKSPTPALYSGGFDKDRKPYITRVYWSTGFNAASVEVFAPHLGDGKGLVTGFSFPFDTTSHGIITHVAIDTANPLTWQILARLVLTTSTGAVELWQQDKLQWTREEGLASLQVAKFVELPEVTAQEVAEELQQTFGVRLKRHLERLTDLPPYLVNFVKRFATGSYASVTSAATSTQGSLTRDAFGFRQIILGVTGRGKVCALDSSNGNILWSKLLGHGWASEVGGAVIFPRKLFITKTVNEGGPHAVLVVERKANNGLIDTVLFHFDAITGLAVDPNDRKRDRLLHGKDLIQGTLSETLLLGGEGETKVVIMIDEFGKTYLYPDTEDAQTALSKAAPSMYFPHLDGNRLVGQQLIHNPDLSKRHTVHPAWQLSLPPGESILSVVAPSQGPVASLGKVLGNRTTLYKYLNPRLFVVTTQKGVYAVDAAKGATVYHAEVPDGRDITATLTENWLVYHYWSGEVDKGYRLVSVEFYEGQGVDEKTKSSEASAFSNAVTELTAYERAFVYPTQITALTTTSTKFGISGKDLIVSTKGNKVHSISRRLLDPRRPNRKPSTDEAEEQLVQYHPVVGQDPKRTLSHNYPVAKTESIVTAPTLLESTSLVFAHGLDLFMTRVAPSGTFDVLSEGFNKAQLVFTSLGLFVAIAFTKPMVRKKRLREKWYQ